MRLVRIVKLYKQYNQRKQDKLKKEQGIVEKEEVELEESRVGKMLSELTTRRVIIMVLAMLFIIPLFDVGYWNSDDPYYSRGLETISRMYNDRDSPSDWPTELKFEYVGEFTWPKHS